MLFGDSLFCSADNSIHGGSETAMKKRRGAKDKKGMCPRSFHNNPCSKLLLLLVGISGQDAGVSCSISPPDPRGAQGKSQTEPKVPLQEGAGREPSRVTVTCIAGTSLGQKRNGGWRCWAGGGEIPDGTLSPPAPPEEGKHQSRDGRVPEGRSV